MFYCCGTLLVFLSVRDRVYNTQNADNSSQSNTYKTFLPLAFVRSGYVRPDNGILTATGYEGGNWSRSSGASASVARHLTLSAQGIITSNSNGRLFGFPLRCLYPGSA